MTGAPPALKADFLCGASSSKRFPEPLAFELAFLGRSNCGKSSLLNFFLGRKNAARVSSLPGRTREINFFRVLFAKGADPFLIADLPGYGFAAAPKAVVRGWRDLAESYLASPGRRKALLLTDARRGIAAEEEMLLNLLEHLETPVVLVATKCDKLGRGELALRERELKTVLNGRAPLVLSSTLKRLGREELIKIALPEECREAASALRGKESASGGGKDPKGGGSGAERA
jgi:GTP-binding protein